MQDTVYQIVSTRTVNTQHGQSIIPSLQKTDGSCCSVWVCGMLTKELLQNPIILLLLLIYFNSIVKDDIQLRKHKHNRLANTIKN